MNGKLSLEVQIDVGRSPLTRFQISLLTAKQTWHNVGLELKVMSQVNHEQSNPFNKDSKGTLKSVRIKGVSLLSGLLNLGEM